MLERKSWHLSSLIQPHLPILINLFIDITFLEYGAGKLLRRRKSIFKIIKILGDVQGSKKNFVDSLFLSSLEAKESKVNIKLLNHLWFNGNQHMHQLNDPCKQKSSNSRFYTIKQHQPRFLFYFIGNLEREWERACWLLGTWDEIASLSPSTLLRVQLLGNSDSKSIKINNQQLFAISSFNKLSKSQSGVRLEVFRHSLAAIFACGEIMICNIIVITSNVIDIRPYPRNSTAQFSIV